MADSRTLLVRGLALECLIGVHAHELDRVQRVLVDVELEVEPTRHNDDVGQVISYVDVVNRIRGLAANGHLHLVETFAEQVADRCLAFDGALSVKVTVLKPDVLSGAATVGVELRRNRYNA